MIQFLEHLSFHAAHAIHHYIDIRYMYILLTTYT